MTFLDEVRKKLDLPPAEKEQVMRELESHYHEVEDEALSTGMNKCEASAEAAKRLGDPSDIAQRMQTVHTRATWKTAFLTALPLLGFAVINTLLSILGKLHISESSHDTIWAFMMFLAGTTMLIGSIREIKADRRPLWLATWLPMGIQVLAGLIPAVISNFSKEITFDISLTGSIGMVMLYVIPVIFVGTLALWVSWQSMQWKSAIIAIIALGLLANVFVTQTVIHNIHHSTRIYNLTHAINSMIFVIITLLLAIKLFLKHPYGNKIQSSLMLYIFLNPGLPTNGDKNRIWLIASLIMSGLAVLLLARTTKWQIKQWLFSTAIIVLCLKGAAVSLLATHTSLYDSVMMVIAYGVIAMGYIAWIVFVPEMIDRYSKKHKPELAH